MLIKIEPFKYDELAAGLLEHCPAKAPIGYVCGQCGATHVKLWRHYQTFLEHQGLFCAPCAEAHQKKPAKEYGHYSGDQIGWLVPAVPTENGETFWGYTSIPQPGCIWWYGLHTRPQPTQLIAALTEIRQAGSNEHPTAQWMQQVAAHALEPQKAPHPGPQGATDDPVWAIIRYDDNNFMWSRENGWVNSPTFDTFTYAERLRFELPADGRWVRVAS